MLFNDLDFDQKLAVIHKLVLDLFLLKKDIMDLEECAQYTGLSKSYLYKMTALHEVPHFKPGGKKIFFKKEEIDAWLMRNRVKTDEELRLDVGNGMKGKPFRR